jgi:crossover junction endodeoxyribonuclease RuvC
MSSGYLPTPKAMRILAIDPGYARLGVAILEGNPSRPTLVMSECVEPAKGALEDQLAHIATRVSEVIKSYAPEALAIETLFFNMNKKTAIGVAQARGTVLSIAGQAHLPVIECSPQQIKLAVTGHGGADKRAVANMIPKLLVLPLKKRRDDELDAIALGITALAFGTRSS